MKKIILLFVSIGVFSFCINAQTAKNTKLPANINKMTNGDSLKLLENPIIKLRLKKLLGKKNYDEFLESFETVTPIEQKGSFLFTSGCLIHACSKAESAIAIDLTNKTIHTSIYRLGEKTKYFNENRRKTPKAIRDWANRLASLNE